MSRNSLADLRPDGRNARRHNPRNVAMIQDALQEVGAARSIVIDESGRVLAGNATIEAAAAAGIENVQIVDADGETIIAVRRSGLTEAQKQRLALYDNRAAELADWDADILAAIRAEDDSALDGLWFDEELEAVIGSVNGHGEPIDDPGAQIERAEELREKWQTEAGQLWQVGRHRLLCGDATSAEDVARLMDGATAEILWTDPPYGVDYVGKTADKLKLKNDDAAGTLNLLVAAFPLAEEACIPSAPFYIAHPPGPMSLVFGDAIREAGWRLHQTLVWAKDSMVLGHADYHYQHEPIYYGYLPGPGRPGRGKHEGSRWFGDHSQTTLFSYDRPKRSEEHPTIKPVELVTHCLRNSSQSGGLVYDPFLGSGTTMVAAEQLGRICYGMDIEPKYVAVALERMAEMGLEPERVD